MLMLISALLIKLRVNFRNVNYHFFPQICDTLQTYLTQPNNKFYSPTLHFTSIFHISKSFAVLQLNFVRVRCQLYSVKINRFLFSTNSADALISLILKFCVLSRVNFLYWEANLSSFRVNLTRVNFKYVN